MAIVSRKSYILTAFIEIYSKTYTWKKERFLKQSRIVIELKLSGKLFFIAFCKNILAGGGLYSLVYIFPVLNFMVISASENEEQV